MQREIKGIMTDIGGVLYVGDEAISGAPGTLDGLRAHYPLRLISNTTQLTPEMVKAHLEKLGFAIGADEMYTALAVTKAYLEKQKCHAYLILTDAAEAYFSDMPKGEVSCVVVGDARENFSFDRLNRAFRYLEQGAKLIGASKSRYYKDSDGGLTMGAGGWITALEFASGKEAKIIGKPSKDFFHLVADSMGLEPREILMVGDDIDSDIGGAQRAGFKTALVQTGKYKADDLEREITPDIVLKDFSKLTEWLLC